MPEVRGRTAARALVACQQPVVFALQQELPCQSMTETLHLTIVYEDGGDGWIVASIPEVPGALSQGHTRQEARENVIDALRGVLQLRLASTLSRSLPPTASCWS
jgi:predicted RNase H-like HicB family nuclease